MKPKSCLKAATAAMLSALMLLSAVSYAGAEDVIATYTVDGVDIAVQNNSAVVFTSGSTGMTEGYEVVVGADGIVVSVGSFGGTVPEGGFIIASHGSRKLKLKRFAKVGERVVFDVMSLTAVNVPENYNPYYTKTMAYNAVNTTRSSDTTIIYRGKATTQTNVWGIEAVVDADGFIISVGGNDNAIPEGGFVISSVGNKKTVLSENCVVGMHVTLDESAKTINLDYNKDSYVRELDIACADITAALDKARTEYRNIDYDLALSLLGDMKKKASDAKEKIASGDIAGCYADKLAFSVLRSRAENSLNETPPVEARAMWLRPSETGADAVKKTVKAVYEMGFNTVCLEILYNNTMIIPMPDDSLFEQSPLFNGFDVLKAYVDECHKYGMEVHAWMSVYRVGHDASTYPDLGVGNKKPEWRLVSREGLDYVPNVYGNSHFLNPALGEVSDFLLSTYRYILTNYDIDGFQLDYVRYPENSSYDYGYDDYTRSEYKKVSGVDPIDISKGGAGWNDWCEFRASYVTDFVLEVKAMIDEIRPDVYLSCDLAPHFDTSVTTVMQDAKKWMTQGIAECVFPMAYGEEVVASNTAATVSLAGDNAYTYIGVSDYGTDIFCRQVVQTRENGADGVAFFSYSQYTQGNYASAIRESVFASGAVSPSYDGALAMALQLGYAVDRIENVITLSAFDSPEKATSLVDASKILAGKLEGGTPISGCGDELTNVRDAYTALITDASSARDKAVAEDYRTVFKIAKLSKDDAKREYRNTHPLPEPYVSQPEPENSEPDISEPDTSIGSDKNLLKTVIPVAAIALAAAAASIYIIIKHKRKGTK